MPKRIVVKVGTAVLVNKSRKLDEGIMGHLVKQMAVLWKAGNEIVLVSSGAVGSGRELVTFKKEEATMEKRMLAAVGQSRLINKYRTLFEKYGIEVAQVLPLRDDYSDRDKYVTIRNTLERLMVNRIIPILNENDVLASADLCFNDNDNLAALTAIAVKADRLITLTDVKGLYDSDPSLNKNAKLLREVKEITPALKKACSKSISGLGLGGMINKILSVEIVVRAGIEADICRGKDENALIKAASGEKPGTHFSPVSADKKSKYSGKKSWLAAGVVPTGTIIIDGGAYQALKNGKSLLAVGISDILGEFDSNDVVTIVDAKKNPVGVGMTVYSSGRLNKMLTAPKSQKNALSKELFKKPVIHANYLVIW